MFIDHVRDINIKDRVGLAIYNSATGEGAVEVPLTDDLDQVVNVAWARQAGHYHGSTNIGGGMSVAEDELQQHGREGTFKMVIVLTDGVANWCGGTHDPVAARDHAISQATRAHDLKYKVMTISLGLGADITLMQELADIGDGVHFNVPGGQSVEEMSTDLMEAFAEIARKRPVMLVE
jgi:Mg-chelatase subunit ChlD